MFEHSKLFKIFQLVVPVLKWVRGEPLSQDNWVELFHLIGISKGMTLEKLTFGDLISHASGIINSAEALKVIWCVYFQALLHQLF